MRGEERNCMVGILLVKEVNGELWEKRRVELCKEGCWNKGVGNDKEK